MQRGFRCIAASHQHAICLFGQLDRCGKTMAEIQIESARHIWDRSAQSLSPSKRW
jgi:hypothetical protein